MLWTKAEQEKKTESSWVGTGGHLQFHIGWWLKTLLTYGQKHKAGEKMSHEEIQVRAFEAQGRR